MSKAALTISLAAIVLAAVIIRTLTQAPDDHPGSTELRSHGNQEQVSLAKNSRPQRVNPPQPHLAAKEELQKTFAKLLQGSADMAPDLLSELRKNFDQLPPEEVAELFQSHMENLHANGKQIEYHNWYIYPLCRWWSEFSPEVFLRHAEDNKELRPYLRFPLEVLAKKSPHKMTLYLETHHAKPDPQPPYRQPDDRSHPPESRSAIPKPPR